MKSIFPDAAMQARENDAMLVKEYYDKSIKRGAGYTEQGKQMAALEAYQNLQSWFLKKHGVLWMSCIKKGELEK